MVLFAAALLLLSADNAAAAGGFDQGYHHDLIANVMRVKGYSTASVKIAQVFSWFVDYYGSPYAGQAPDFGNDTAAEDRWFDLIGDAKALQFEGISKASVRPTFDQLASNCQRMIGLMAAQNETVSLLATVGISLRAVQAFYANSEYASALPPSEECGCLVGGSYLTPPGGDDGDAAVAELFALSSSRNAQDGRRVGGYCSGKNVASCVRPRFDDAYAAAFSASWQWLSYLELLADNASAGVYPGEMKETPVAPNEPTYLDALKDSAWAYRISSWSYHPPGTGDGEGEGADDVPPEWLGRSNGHWKGPHSGFEVGYLVAVETYRKLPSVNKGLFTAHGNTTLRGRLTRRLPVLLGDQATPPADYSLMRAPPALRAVQVRITDYDARTAAGSDKPDLYAVVTINGVDFVTGTMRDTGRPNELCWTATYFTTSADAAEAEDEARVRVRVFNENGLGGNAFELPLGPDADEDDPDATFGLRFNVDLATRELSGDMEGTHDTLDKAVTVEGDALTVDLVVRVREVSGDCFTGEDAGPCEPYSDEEACTVRRGQFSAAGSGAAALRWSEAAAALLAAAAAAAAVMVGV